MYKLNIQGVTRISDNASIPADLQNTDYAEYLQWLSEGNTPDPYVAPPPTIPSSVTRLQALLALEAGGYLATVDAYMATLARGDSSRLAWDNAQVFERSSPVVVAMGAMLGLDDAAIDALFIAASTAAL